MATKKTTTTVEETTPEAEEHDKKVLEALENKDTPLEIDPEKMDDKPEEPKVEEKPAEVIPEPLDKDAIKAELKAEVTEEVKKELTDKLEGTKKEQKDAYADFEKQIWDKEGRNPSYKEALDFVKTQAKSEIKAELDAEIAEEEKQQVEAQKQTEAQTAQAQQQLNDTLNKDWDEQLDDLVKSGRIPAIKDPNDNRVQVIKDAEGKETERIPLDPGKRARYDLFKAMYVASDERIKNDAKPITNLKEIYYEHYKKDKQPPGANAPIAGVRKSVSQDKGESFSYNEVHSKSFEDLLREAR